MKILVVNIHPKFAFVNSNLLPCPCVLALVKKDEIFSIAKLFPGEAKLTDLADDVIQLQSNALHTWALGSSEVIHPL